MLPLADGPTRLKIVCSQSNYLVILVTQCQCLSSTLHTLRWQALRSPVGKALGKLQRLLAPKLISELIVRCCVKWHCHYMFIHKVTLAKKQRSDFQSSSQAAKSLPQTVEASHCPSQC